MFATPVSLLYRLRKTEEVSAWGRFVDLYTPLLYHWAQKLGEQESDCADLMQDVFLILWRKLPEFEYDSGKSFHAWLKTIFLNRYRSRLRQRSMATAHSPGLSGVDFSVADFSVADFSVADFSVADFSVADFSVADFSDQLAREDDNRYLIRQAFRLIESEFSSIQQQVFREYVMEERSPEQIISLQSYRGV